MQNKSIKANMFYNTLLTVSSFVFPLFTFTYVARVLTPVGTGKVAFVNSILNYFMYLSTLGIPTYALRECVKVRSNKNELSKLFQELLLINIVSTLISYVLLFACVINISKFNQYKALFWSMSCVLLLNTIGVEWLFKALEEYKYITTRSLILRTIVIPLTFIFVRNENDYIAYGVLTVFTASASSVLNFIKVRKYVSFRRTQCLSIKQHIKPILVLFGSTVIISIYNNFDISMLGFLSTETEVGYYNAALKLKSMLLAVSTSITAVLIPKMVDYYSRQLFSEANKLLKKSLQISMLTALPLVVYTFIYAKDLLIFVCGDKYISAVPSLRVLCLCIIPLILTNIFGNQVLIPMGMEKRFTTSVFVGLWINLVLNSVLIVKIGSVGAAFATLVTEIWNLYYMSAGKKDIRNYLLKSINYGKYLVPILMAAITSIGLGVIFKDTNVFVRLVLTTIIYFFVFGIVHLCFKEETVYPIFVKIRNRMKK